jgi:hypothetical protein
VVFGSVRKNSFMAIPGSSIFPVEGPTASGATRWDMFADCDSGTRARVAGTVFWPTTPTEHLLS